MICGCDKPAEVWLTLLGSTSIDASQPACWECANNVMEEWLYTDLWNDTVGWSVERMGGVHG